MMSTSYAAVPAMVWVEKSIATSRSRWVERAFCISEREEGSIVLEARATSWGVGDIAGLRGVSKGCNNENGKRCATVDDMRIHNSKFLCVAGRRAIWELRVS